MYDDFEVPTATVELEAYVHASALLRDSSGSAPSRVSSLSVTGQPSFYMLVSELPALHQWRTSGPNEGIDEAASHLAGLIRMVSQGEPLRRSPLLRQLAEKAAARAAARAGDSEDEIRQWARKLADEASEFTD